MDATTEPERDPQTRDDRTEDERIKDQLRDHGVKLGKGDIAPTVFWPALIIVVGVALFSIIWSETAGTLWNSLQSSIVSGFGWFYTLAIGTFVVFSLFLAVSRFGNITLGRDGEEAEFNLISWFAMLFAAGMGIGLVFYGVAEPLTFYSDPKPGVEGTDIELANQAMAQTFLHWGLHPWAVYVIVGLSLAYAIHRKGRPVSLRWALETIFGDNVRGPIGDVVDILAIVGTLFGVATSLGLGVTQLSTGLEELGVIENSSNTFMVTLIAIITGIATISVVSGVGKGIQWLSNINLVLAGVFLVAVLALGPTLFLLRDFVQNIGAYGANVVPDTFDAFAYTGQAGLDWAGSWTIFYWGWWIAWSPFVGVFIARISRGRTVREFVIGALLVPTIVGFVWFTVLGGTGIHRERTVGDLVPDGGLVAEVSLFDTLGNLPLGTVLSAIALFLVVVFFVTSSDSGSLVVDMLASGGHPNPPTWSRVLFAVLEGLVAAGLLLAGGKDGLSALQAGSVSTGAPFVIVLVLIMIALYKTLSRDHRRLVAAENRAARREMYAETTDLLADDFDDVFGEQVDHRIDYALSSTRGFRQHDRPQTAVKDRPKGSPRRGDTER